MIELLTLDFVHPVEGVQAFSTTRGEVDKRNAYSGVNLCDYVGDDALRVLDARITLAMQLGVDLDDLVMPRQTHSCRVAVIDERFRSLDIDKQEEALEGVDALVTTLKGVVIGVNTADCVPIVMADGEAGVIAAPLPMPDGAAQWGVSWPMWSRKCAAKGQALTVSRWQWDSASARIALRWVTRWLKRSGRHDLTLMPSSSATMRLARLTSTCVPPTALCLLQPASRLII